MPMLTTGGLLGSPSDLLTFGLGGYYTGVYREDAVMEDAAARIGAIPEFAAGTVYYGATPPEEPAPADAGFAVAWVWPAASDSVEIFPGSSFMERRGAFGIAIEVRDQSPQERQRRLARLEGAVRNAIEGKSLAGACYPSTVRLERGGRDYSVNHPSVRIILIGRYRSPVGGLAAQDTTDRESAWN